MRTRLHALFIVLLLSGCQLIPSHQNEQPLIKMIETSDQFIAQLTRCVDGDTAHLMIDGHDEKVRFLSIDTPEIANSSNPKSEPFGDIASAYTCNALTTANSILVQLDPYENERDQYDRLLAWIWVDGQLLQGSLIDQGYAEVAFVKTENLYSVKLVQIQDTAIAKKKGLWQH